MTVLKTRMVTKNLFKKIAAIVMIALFSLSAWALDIDVAKEQGLVGETPSGYIQSVAKSPSAELANFVKDINAKRKQQYAAIAKKRGIPLKSVEDLAAKKAYQKTKPGHFVQDKSGNWNKK
ncbi:MAG: YdbL family protein [Pseudomonadales bacterium]|nr:YdbL family protein [Pseudomonadales bacterium]